MRGGDLLEEAWIECELALLADPSQSGGEDVGRRRLVVGVRERDLHVQGLQMAKAADVADEQVTAGGEAVEGLGEHVAGIVGRREVLHHRVHDDRVERSVDAVEIMGGAVMQRNSRAEAGGLDLRDARAATTVPERSVAT